VRRLSIQENSLHGECVAFTGLLRETAHRRALEVVAAAGGLPSPRVTRSCTLLVVGMRGWRGMGNGAANGKMRQAEEWQRRGCGPRIIPEGAFWARVGGDPSPPLDALQVCTMAKAVGLTGLPEEQLRRFAQLGLIRSENNGPCFEDLLAMRTIVRTLRQGVTLEEMADKWADLSRLLPEASGHPLNRLVNDPVGGLALLLAEGVLVGESGQLLLDFRPPSRTAPELVPLQSAGAGIDPVGAADTLLDEGAFAEAEAALLQALSHHPEEAGLLVALGKLLIELERYEEAEGLLQQVLATTPEQHEALFCLAVCCEQLQKRQEAIGLWRSFLRTAPTGVRTIIAQAHLLRPVASPPQATV
jgi:hypothetical protein